MKGNINGPEGALTLDELLAAPFLAAAKADSMMAKEQFNNIINLCFEKQKKTDGTLSHRPYLIKMVIERNVIVASKDEGSEIEHQSASMILSVPMLTLLPISSLSITNVELDYSLEVMSQMKITKSATNQEGSTSDGQPKKISRKPVIRAKVTKKSNNTNNSNAETSTKSTLDVKMQATQTPLPEGLKILVDAFSKHLNTSPHSAD